MRDVQKRATGYCPEQDAQYGITVTFSEYRQIGGPPLIRKGSFKCSYESSHGCKTCGATGINCPIYQQAKY